MINGTMERRLMDRTGLVSVWTLSVDWTVWTVEEEQPKGSRWFEWRMVWV